MNIISRRVFIRSSALAVGSLALARGRAASPSDEIRIAVVGLRGRGGSLVKDVFRTEGARLVALCDVDSRFLAEEARKVEEEYGEKVALYEDFRDALDSKDVDAVVLTTPNHWHALQTIWACQAGKDVYVEKPVCHSIWEGRKMVEAARKYKRIVQSGFQNRSDIGLKEAFPWIKAGNIGPIKMVRGLCYRNRKSIGKLDHKLEPPETTNYNLWLGPAKDEPIYRPQLHYDWHWVWNTGNGDIGNQGPHEMDLIRWILDDPTHPRHVFSFGGRFGWDDAGETPNMQIASLDWGGIPVLFEVRDMWIKPDVNSAPNFKGSRVGVVITCEDGEFRGGRGGGIVYDNDGNRVMRFKGDGGYDHFPSFIRAIRSRKTSDLACPIETGYKSSVLSFMSNISYRTGKQRSEKRMAKRVAESEILSEAYDRYMEQLANWNIDFRKERWTEGRELTFDPVAELFVGKHGEKASRYIKRDYRSEFQVPAVV